MMSIGGELRDYQYELKPLSDDFLPTKDIRTHINKKNVRIFRWICWHILWYFLRLFEIVVCVFFLLDYTYIYFFVSQKYFSPLVVVIDTKIVNAPVFSSNLGVDIFHGGKH